VKDKKELQKINEHNTALHNEYLDGEDGIETMEKGPNDPKDFDVKKFEREIRAEMKSIMHTDPERAKGLREKVIANDTWLDDVMQNSNIPDDEIKFYPGSAKGPDPEDDPEEYSRWFVEN